MPDTPEKKSPENVAEGPASPDGDPGAVYAPRRADTQSESPVSGSPIELPPAKDIEKLKLATSDMVEFGISLEEAAGHHGVDLDTLHVWYRTYVNFADDDTIKEPVKAKLRGVDPFDQVTHRHFDMNWAEMVYRAEQERPQMSPVRRWLVSSPFTGWMFQNEVVDKVAVSGVVCVVGLGIFAVILTNRDRDATLRGEAPRSAVEPAGAGVGNFDDDQQQALMGQIVEAMDQFVTFETWQERLPHVRFPDKVAPFMEAYYKTHPDGPLAPVVLKSEISFLKRADGRFALVQGESRRENSPPRALPFLIQLVDQDPRFLFDWEILVNYEPQPWGEFVASRSTQPAPFRVRLSEGDYYNGHFFDSRKFLGFRMERFDSSDEYYVYALRGSEIATKIERGINSNLAKSVSLILNLRFPGDAKFDNLLEIESVASDSW